MQRTDLTSLPCWSIVQPYRTEQRARRSLKEQPTGILARLREETRPAHDRLERGLGLVSGALARETIVQLLGRFHGFFYSWEPALARCLQDDAFLRPRLKLATVRRDLLALGLREPELDRLPVCPDAAPFSCPAGALGSLYVVEGSTLGGQIIARRMADSPWLPAEGLDYFRSYGPAVGKRCRGFRRRLELTASPENEELIVRSAWLTFARLDAWLCRAI